MAGVQRVAQYMPFLTIELREECGRLLHERLRGLGLLNEHGRIDASRFMDFMCEQA